MTAQSLAMTAQLLAMTAQSLAMTAQLLAMTAQSLAMTAQLLAMTAQLLAMTAQSLAMTSQLLAMTAQLLAISTPQPAIAPRQSPAVGGFIQPCRRSTPKGHFIGSEFRGHLSRPVGRVQSSEFTTASELATDGARMHTDQIRAGRRDGNANAKTPRPPSPP
jgi:hypothetical protein